MTDEEFNELDKLTNLAAERWNKLENLADFAKALVWCCIEDPIRQQCFIDNIDRIKGTKP